MVKDIVEVARALFDRRDTMIKNKKEKCDHLAKYFEGIAETLEELAEGTKVGQLHPGKVTQLATYADLLPETVGNALTLMDADELTARLKKAYDIRELEFEIKRNRQQVISEIQKASGLFKALGASCRIHY